jgi:hypothetical protein
MTYSLIKAALLTAAIGLAATSAARADCESDLKQLEHAFTTPNLAASAKTALDEAKVKAVAALKKDDDKSCHTAVAEGLSKAGIKMK